MLTTAPGLTRDQLAARAAAELRAEEHVDGVGQQRCQVHNGRVERDKRCPQRPQRRQHGAENRRVHHRRRHRPRLVDRQHDVPRHDLLPPPVPDEPLGDHRPVRRNVPGEIGGDGPGPVSFNTLKLPTRHLVVYLGVDLDVTQRKTTV